MIILIGIAIAVAIVWANKKAEDKEKDPIEHWEPPEELHITHTEEKK